MGHGRKTFRKKTLKTRAKKKFEKGLKKNGGLILKPKKLRERKAKKDLLFAPPS
jgi:hypothetical protein